MSQSTRLSLPYLAAAQAQKHVTVNESLLRLDAVVQLSARSATTSAQPASPSDGDVYLLPAGKTGVAWGVMADGAIAYFRDTAKSQEPITASRPSPPRGAPKLPSTTKFLP
jgi:hypothetical protein